MPRPYRTPEIIDNYIISTNKAARCRWNSFIKNNIIKITEPKRKLVGKIVLKNKRILVLENKNFPRIETFTFADFITDNIRIELY
jgi:hypothetical protein